MHPRVYQEFEDICKRRRAGGSVLEIGAVPSDQSLLCMQSLKNARAKIGVNLDGPYKYKDINILKCNANNMICFDNDRFDTILCNAVLEHDKYFWKTISEINRVLKPGGLLVIGVPGYKSYKIEGLQWMIGKLLRNIKLLEYIIPNYSSALSFIWSTTVTFVVHNCPADYYRFSQLAVKEVFLDGLTQIEMSTIQIPPRIIGSAIKP